MRIHMYANGSKYRNICTQTANVTLKHMQTAIKMVIIRLKYLLLLRFNCGRLI